MLTPVMHGVDGRAAHHRRRRASERLPVRGDPGRHLDRARAARDGRHLREPRDVHGAVPVRHRGADGGERRERLRQRAGEPAEPQPAQRGESSTARSSIPSSANYQRFCSNYLATARSRLRSRHPLHERGGDRTTCSGRRTAWPPADRRRRTRSRSASSSRSTSETGKHKSIYGMGRHNHENAVAIPGFEDLVVLSGDDTFISNPDDPGRRSSDMYGAVAALLVHRVGPTRAGTTRGRCGRSSPTTPRSTTTTTSPRRRRRRRHRAVHRGARDIATGKTARTRPRTSTSRFRRLPEAGSATPPTRRARRPAVGARSGEAGATRTADVFHFVRVEDIAYDKRTGHANVVYLADSGRGTAGTRPRTLDERPGLEDGARPERPDEGDVALRDRGRATTAPVKTLGEIHQPDNIETTPSGALHPGGSGIEPAVPGRLDRPERDDGTTLVGTVYTAPRGRREGRPVGGRGRPTSTDAPQATGVRGRRAASSTRRRSSAPARSWSTSRPARCGIETAPGDDNNGDGQPDCTYKRAGGQLLLLRIPGA